MNEGKRQVSWRRLFSLYSAQSFKCARRLLLSERAPLSFLFHHAFSPSIYTLKSVSCKVFEGTWSLDSRILTEAQEYGVNCHVIDIKEQDCYSIRKNHHDLKLN